MIEILVTNKSRGYYNSFNLVLIFLGETGRRGDGETSPSTDRLALTIRYLSKRIWQMPYKKAF